MSGAKRIHTIGILEKIVDGMRVSFDEPIARQEAGGYVLERERMLPAKETEGQYGLYNCLPFEKGRNFELYVVEIEPGGSCCPDLYVERSYAYIGVTAGKLGISVGNREFCVKQGGKEHTYRNKGGRCLSITVFRTLH